MKKNAVVSFNGQKDIHATINLTGSKSESNRALIIAALSKGMVMVKNLSDAADTVILNNILIELTTAALDERRTVNVGHAGTAMRFLTAFLSTIPEKFRLTGSGRMQERPIGILVDALKSLGADISYENNEGYPPLLINGGMKDTPSEVSIQGNQADLEKFCQFAAGKNIPVSQGTVPDDDPVKQHGVLIATLFGMIFFIGGILWLCFKLMNTSSH